MAKRKDRNAKRLKEQVDRLVMDDLKRQLEQAQAEIESHKIARDLWMDESNHLRQALKEIVSNKCEEEILVYENEYEKVKRIARKALEGSDNGI